MEENKPETIVIVEQKQAGSITKKNRALLYVSGLIFLLVSALIVFLFFNQKIGPSPKQSYTDESIQTEVIKGSEYLTSQRNENGAYAYQKYSEEVCPLKDGKINCSFLSHNVSFPSNTWSALGHYAAYKITLDQKYLEYSKRDLHTLIAWCEHKENDCSYLLSQPAIINLDLKDAKVTEFLRVQGEKLVSKIPEKHLILAGIEVRQLAQLYELFNKPIYLQEAEKRLTALEINLQKESVNPATGVVSLPKFSCWASLAHVELGKAKKDRQMIVNAVEYLKQSNRLDEINNFENPVMVQPCIEAIFLASETETGYKEEGKNMFNKFLANFYDTPSNKIYSGLYATTFNSKDAISKGQQKNIFLADSAYTNYLKFLSVK